MESNNETEITGPSSASDSNFKKQIQYGDGLLPTVENLPTETFPSYFTQTDDISLVHLVSNSPQYKSIVRDVFAKRYAKKYFKFEEEPEHDQTEYFALFILFGDIIKAIQVDGIQYIDDNHWLVQLLNKHTPNLKKLCFKKCSFRNVDDFLSQHISIKHLTIRGGTCERKTYRIELPEYRNLKSLELDNFSHITKHSLEQVLCRNPEMEELILRFCDPYLTLSSFIAMISTHLKYLKKSNKLDDYVIGANIRSVHRMTFVSMLKSLDSYGMKSIIYEKQLQRVVTDREDTKCLHLDGYYDRFNKEVIETICSFDEVETLSIGYYSHEEQLEMVIENLPNLKYLHFSHISHRTNSQILSILSKCRCLEKCVIESENLSNTRKNYDKFLYNRNVHFHDKFIEVTPNPHIRLEFKENQQIIGVVTKDEIIWRNKRLHWIGYDPIHSRSSVKLLDLAIVPEGSNVKHKQPLNLILNYLDLDSLYSFGMASKKCKQLVHNYIYQRCKQSSKKRAQQRSIERDKLCITDEFGMNFDGLRMFGKNVKYLKVNLLDYEGTRELLKEIEKHCKHLTKLCFHTRHRIDPHDFILPQIRHFIFYGYGLSKEYRFHCDLSVLAEKCPNLEIFEMRTIVNLYTSCLKKQKISFKNLQKIKFKPCDESQVAYAKNLFKDSETEIVIDR